MAKKKERISVHRPMPPEIQDGVSQQHSKALVEKLKQDDLDKLLSEDAEKFLAQNRQKGGE